MRVNFVSTRLVKEKGVNYKTLINITSPNAVVTAINDLMELEDLTTEHLVMLMMDTKNNVIGATTVSQGTVNASLVSPREIFSIALLQGAVNIIIAHNHPSGNPQPSQEDLDVTKRVKEAGEIIGVKLLDHLIIGQSNYISLKEKGYL